MRRVFGIYGADRGAFAYACGHSVRPETLQTTSNAMLPKPWIVSTKHRPGDQEIPT